jgi:hypothetical protein
MSEKPTGHVEERQGEKAKNRCNHAKCATV